MGMAGESAIDLMDPGGDLLEDTAYDSADIPVLRAPQGDPTMFADDCACDCACPCMS